MANEKMFVISWRQILLPVLRLLLILVFFISANAIGDTVRCTIENNTNGTLIIKSYGGAVIPPPYMPPTGGYQESKAEIEHECVPATCPEELTIKIESSIPMKSQVLSGSRTTWVYSSHGYLNDVYSLTLNCSDRLVISTYQVYPTYKIQAENCKHNNSFGKNLVSISGSGGTLFFRYKKETDEDFSDWSTSIPNAWDAGEDEWWDAGEYIVQWYAEENENYHKMPIDSVKVTIGKDSSYPDFIKPVLSGEQIYSGEPLCSEGSTSFGSIYYTTTETNTPPDSNSSDWSLAVPTKNKVGSYYVWYKIVGDKNHENLLPTIVNKSPIRIRKTLDDLDIVISDIPSQTYNGSIICPDVYVTDGVKKLNQETDYTIECSNNTHVGTASIIITGINDYAGKIIKQFSITKAPLKIVANDTSIVYGEEPASAGVVYIGFVGSDDSNVLSGELQYIYSYEKFDDKGEYVIIPKGLTSNDYEITFVEGLLTVKAKEISIVWNESFFTYNGKEQYPTAIAEGVVNGDECLISVEGSGINVGKYITRAITLSNDNYKLPLSNEIEFSITKKEISIVWNESFFTYNGKEQYPTAIAEGIVNGDECLISVEGSGSNVGSYTARAMSLNNDNYTLPENTETSFAIVKASPTIVAPLAVEGLVYSGKQHQLIIGGSTDFGFLEYSLDGRTFSTEIPHGRDAGEYTIYYRVAGSDNWNAVEACFIKVIILAKEISIVWGEDAFPYNGMEHIPTATAIGLVGGDECAIVVAGAKVNAGTYTARAVALNNSNYKLPQNVEKKFTIVNSNSIHSVKSVTNKRFDFSMSHNEILVNNPIAQELNVFVLDLQGKLKKRYRSYISGNHHISLNHLNRGMYIIKIVCEGKLHIRRIQIK